MDYRVLGMLGANIDRDGWCTRSQVKLAKQLKCSRSTVQASLMRLRKIGVVHQTENTTNDGRDCSHNYRIFFDLGNEELVSDPSLNEKPRPADISAAPADPMRRHPLPVHGSAPYKNDPLKMNHLITKEREGAALVLIEKKETSMPGEELELDENPNTAALQIRVQNFCNGTGFSAGVWPQWDRATLKYHGDRFAELSTKDRLKAETWRDAYLRDKKSRGEKVQITPGNFFRDRMWEALDQKILQKSGPTKQVAVPKDNHQRPKGWANAWSPVFNAFMIAELLNGRQDGYQGEGTPFMRVNIQRAYPGYADLLRSAEQNQGKVFSERWHGLKDELEFVHCSTKLDAWREEFKRREWVWPLKFDQAKGANLPKGGPDGLSAFEVALAAQVDCRESTVDEAH
jgi:hypothetical protein